MPAGVDALVPGRPRVRGPGARSLEPMATHTTEGEQAAAAETRTFDELGLSAEALSAIRDAGYEHPTPIQAQSIPLILKGRDVMGLAQTGTGKTAAFTLPIVDRLLNGP